MTVARILLANIQTEIVNQNVELIDSIRKTNNAEFETMHHKSTANEQSKKAKSLAEENKRLEEENEFYKNLLSKPMVEIAKEHGDFREAYHKQQEILSTWIISQRAFKEIAMKYGKQAGKSKEDIINESKETEQKVLDNETEYDNHVEDIKINGIYLKEINKRKLGRSK